MLAFRIGPEVGRKELTLHTESAFDYKEVVSKEKRKMEAIG